MVHTVLKVRGKGIFFSKVRENQGIWKILVEKSGKVRESQGKVFTKYFSF
jgi:hypothetical protein